MTHLTFIVTIPSLTFTPSQFLAYVYSLGSAFASAGGAAGASDISLLASGAVSFSASEEVQRVFKALVYTVIAEETWGTNQVVSQQLHDQGRVLVAFLTQGIELCGIISTSSQMCASG